jgi:hypothetical protein
MRRDWRRPIVVMGVAAAVLGFQSMASPQWIQYPTANLPRTPDGRPDLSAPAPRTADGRPDFSGVWENVGYENAVEGLGPPPRTVFFDLSFGMDGPPPYRPWAAELYAHRKEENSKDNPDARCLPIGALQMLVHPLPKKIVQIPGLLLLLHERNMEYRQIFTDGRALPEDPRPAWYGYSSGRWENDTLVVETIGFNDELWADFNGSPLTDAARMTERFTRPSFGTLEIEVTIDDSKAYTRPWTVSANHRLAPDTDLLEYACLENERSVEHLVGP